MYPSFKTHGLLTLHIIPKCPQRLQTKCYPNRKLLQQAAMMGFGYVALQVPAPISLCVPPPLQTDRTPQCRKWSLDSWPRCGKVRKLPANYPFSCIPEPSVKNYIECEVEQVRKTPTGTQLFFPCKHDKCGKCEDFTAWVAEGDERVRVHVLGEGDGLGPLVDSGKTGNGNGGGDFGYV